MSSVRTLRFRPSILACLAVILGIVLALGMTKSLDHDENQFVAAGALLARRGLLPYRDYPYFHMPNLVFINALLFRYCDHLLLAARAVSIACGFGTAAVLFAAARVLYAPLGGRGAWVAPILAASVLITQPLFAGTSGRAWNHDLPVLLTLLAFLAALRASSSPSGSSSLGQAISGSTARRALWQIASGALLGAAIGTRLTFAPAFLALAVMIWAGPNSAGRRWAGIMRFGGATAAALAPSFWLMALAPAQFAFGNFLYPGLNTAFRRETGYPKAMTVFGKVLYIFTDVLPRPASLLMFLALVASLATLALSRAHRRRQGRDGPPHPHRFAIGSLLLLIVCLLVGTFAPTPLFPVYFYAPLPFAMLLILYIAADPVHLPSVIRLRRQLAWSGIAAVALGMTAYDQIKHPRDLALWVPIDVHRMGHTICHQCPPGPILTLAPIFALEGGTEIYEELATGPFAMRAGAQLNESNERQYKLMDEDDLPELFDRRPPSGVLTGLERGPDDAIAAIARDRGFVDRGQFAYRHKTLLLQTPPLDQPP